MKFTLIKFCPKETGHGIAVRGDLVQVAEWVKSEWNDNEISDKIDSFFDGWGDLVRGDDGKLYMAERLWCSTEHDGEYGIWCEIVNQNLKF